MQRLTMSPSVWRTLKQAGLGIVFTVLVVVLIMWLAGSFHSKIDTTRIGVRESESRPMGDVEMVEVRTIRVPVTETAVGSINTVHEISLASKILAKVLEVNVRAGQLVKKDDVLVRLDNADLNARLQQARAAVDAATAAHDQAKIELERIQQLFESNNAAPIELDRVKTAMKAADAELKRTQQAQQETAVTLEYTVVRSPIAGKVVDKRIEVGDTATPGRVLVTLFDPSRMQLVASVRESLTQRLAVGQNIGVHIDAIGKTCQGQISEIVPEAESASRTFSVKVTGPCPPGVYSGMFGRLLIPLDVEELVVISKAAVRRVGQLDMVDVVEGGVPARRIVQLGREIGADVQVLSGLRTGERIAVKRS